MAHEVKVLCLIAFLGPPEATAESLVSVALQKLFLSFLLWLPDTYEKSRKEQKRKKNKTN